MSAQAGVWNLDRQPIDARVLEKLSCALQPNGSDNVKTCSGNSWAMIYLGFETTPKSKLELQPYESRLGNVITWDGRLDNRSDLTVQLLHQSYSLDTDVEVVAAAFEQWGTECFHKFKGEWAVAIWNASQKELFLAVDVVTSHRLFYYRSESRVIWSSTIASIVLAVEAKLHLDDDYIAGYLVSEPAAWATPYSEIRQVPAGHSVSVRSGGVSSVKYSRMGSQSLIHYRTDQEYEEHFRHVFRSAVRRRLHSCTPVLAELSGGLDSSSIVCMADDILKHEGALTPRLDTLSYFDLNEPSGDDLIYVKKIEDKRGRRGHHIDAGRYGYADAFQYSEFAAIPGHLGVARQLLERRAAIVKNGDYRVVLSGLGGDEFLGGIPDPRAQLADLIQRCEFIEFIKSLRAWGLVKRLPLFQLFFQSVEELLSPLLRSRFVNKARIEPWFHSKMANVVARVARHPSSIQCDKTLLPTQRAFLSGLESISNRLAKREAPALCLEEVRYPCLDQDLLEFLFAIPPTQLLRPGERRSLMRRSLTNYLPKEVLMRRTKQVGARTPMLGVDRNWTELTRMFTSPLSEHAGYIDGARFVETLQMSKSGKRTHLVQLLRAISLELWLRDIATRRLVDLPFLRQPDMDAAIPTSHFSNCAISLASRADQTP